MLNEKGENKVQDDVVPKLIAYKAVMVIRDIQLRKYEEEKHEKKKRELKGETVPEKEEEKVEEPEPVKPPAPYNPYAKKKEEEEPEIDLEAIEREKEAAERKIYGRYWIWEGYFNEKKKDLWL